MSGPTLSGYLSASSSAYSLTNSTGLVLPPGMTLLAKSDPSLQSDGFSAVAMQDSDGNIIIAFEGTSPNVLTTFGRGSLAADAVIANNGTPQALVDAQQFALTVQAQYGDQGQIYVTGHSLGGIEAQAASQALGDSCAGGATFGATGLPGNSISADSPDAPQNLINYVDYGDPVGNLSSDPQTALTSIVTGDMYHYGQVVMVGNPSDAAALQNAASTYSTSLTSPDPWSGGARGTFLIFDATCAD